MEFLIGSFILYSLASVLTITPAGLFLIWRGYQNGEIGIWKVTDVFILIIPWATYIGVHHIGPGKGGATNFLHESASMSVILPIILCVKMITTNNFQRYLVNILFVIGTIITAFSLRLFVPAFID